MDEVIRVAEQLETEAETFKNLAAGAEPTGEVHLHANVIAGFGKRFSQMAESLRKITEKT